jgi:glyoxylase-like metal-dependent hydrolase (beta-lactamase superfamily II)
VLTHAHADHVGFAEQRRRKLDIPVYVHRDDAELAGNLRPFGSTAGSMAPYFRYPTCLRFVGARFTHPATRRDMRPSCRVRS